MKRTEWYPASVKPVREGEYEVRYRVDGIIFRRLWKDGRWQLPCGSPGMFGALDDQWRGLAQPSEDSEK